VPNRLCFLSVSDVRGDLDLVAKAIAHAQSKEVVAQGIFFLGNFVGPVLSKPEYLTIESARRTLQNELRAHEPVYKEQGIFNVWALMNHMQRNPDRYRRGAELSAINYYRQLLGRKDDGGRFTEFGVAARKAKAIYAQALKLFQKSKIPVYLMADTVFAEDVPEQYWLHFSWVSLSGFSMRCVGAAEIDDREAIPEYFMGPRRGGRLVRIEGYPFSSADIIFAYVLSPVLHEVLSTHERKFVVMCGDGQIDTGYVRNIVSTQRPRMAYAYAVDGTKVVRRSYDYIEGAFGQAVIEDGQDHSSTTRFIRKSGIKRAEIETQVKLASLGSDLVRFVDLLRKENPDMADQMEKAESRAEAIFRYVQYLEQGRDGLRSILAAERAGFERLISKVTPYFTPEQNAAFNDLLKERPDASAAVEAVDRANERIADLMTRILAERFGAAPSPPAQTPSSLNLPALPAASPSPAVEQTRIIEDPNP
jgi:hypothetical protein